jgi:putative transposase
MSFWRHCHHLVWATRGREPSIQPGIEGPLRAYIVSKSAELGVHIYAIGSCRDHIHLVAAIPPRLSVAQVVKTVKGASSHFVNHVLCPPERFAWQHGYGSMTMGATQRAAAVAYVESQKQHHAQGMANAWLERYCERESGPPEIRQQPDEKLRIVRERVADYDVAEVPF